MTDAAEITRRDLLVKGGVVAGGLMVFPSEIGARLADLDPQEAVIPWVERPPEPSEVNVLDWERHSSFITPVEKHFRVGHYGTPSLAESDWSLEVTGLVRRPMTLTLNQIKARPRREVAFTLECAGNRGFPTFIGAVYNARWAGASLASVLEEAGVLEDGIEVVFWGADEGEEEIRGNTVTQNFARSLSIEDAMEPDMLLCYEVNDATLTPAHGFPLRLIAPGWYGVANVKWLTRIELRDRRFMGRFMGRDYVTLRQEEQSGRMVWTESSVGRTQINSIPAKVTKAGPRYRIHGAAWGTDIEGVEVRIDDGPWRRAPLGRGQDSGFTWTLWHLDWPSPAPGEHAVTSRAIGKNGRIQPAPDDPAITTKKTYWESNQQVTRRIRIA